MITSSSGISDDPIDGSASEPDLLGRTAFAELVADAIRSTARLPASTVIALVGPWGSGKTSLIRMATSGLSHALPDREPDAAQASLPGANASWEVVEFNPWFFQDLPSLQWGFLSALFDAIAPPAKKRSKTVRRALQSFGNTIAPLGVAGSLVGVDMSTVLRAASELVGPNRSVERQHSALSNLLSERSEPVLIVLDDLDRLSPDELLLVFKLIRLIGRLPFVHYLIAYDEETLLDVLSRTGLVGIDEPHRAGSYLEKMVQLRLDVPPLRGAQIDGLTDVALDQMIRSVGLQMDQRQTNEFAITWQSYMQGQMRTPRAIKRYITQVEALYPAVADEVDAVDFLLFSWLKVVAPKLLAALPSEKSTLTGTSGSLSSVFLASRSKPQDFSDRWRDILERAELAPGASSAVAGVTGKLFPRFSAIYNREQHFPGGSPGVKRIASPDYFDRYFALGVPSEDISDAILGEAYRSIIEHPEAEIAEPLRTALRTNTRLAVAKLEARFDEDPKGGDAFALLRFLAARVDQVPVGQDLFGPRRQMEGICVRLYLRLEPKSEVIVEAVEKIATLPSGLRLVALLTGQARSHQFYGSAEDIEARQEAYPAGLARYGEMIVAAFDAHQDANVFDIASDIWSGLWDWRSIDLPGAQRWLTSQFESGRWSRLDAAARLVTCTAPIGTEEWSISELDLSVVEDLIGVEALIADCGKLAPLGSDELVEPRTPATRSSRRDYVRTVVQSLVEGRLSSQDAQED
ncbi:KAP family P-loop NTPase fold protein [Microbacterium sp. NPDC055903]